MWRSLAFFAFSSLIVQLTMGQGNEIPPKGIADVKANETKEHGSSKSDYETLAVSVKITENDGSNGPTILQVNFKVTIEKDIVKVNGKLTELDVLTSYELDVEIVGPLKILRTATVTVNVLVMRQEFDNGYKFFLEEQVTFVEGKKVDQIDIKSLTIHMHKNGKEYDRTTEMISFEQSHMKDKNVQKICHKGDDAPKMNEPELPDERGLRNPGLHRKKSFCTKFHKLPFAARIGILVSVIFVLIASVLCCACFCCRKPKNVYDMSTIEEKPDFDLEIEAEPLPEKLAFDDKQVLLA